MWREYSINHMFLFRIWIQTRAHSWHNTFRLRHTSALVFWHIQIYTVTNRKYIFHSIVINLDRIWKFRAITVQKYIHRHQQQYRHMMTSSAVVNKVNIFHVTKVKYKVLCDIYPLCLGTTDANLTHWGLEKNICIRELGYHDNGFAACSGPNHDLNQCCFINLRIHFNDKMNQNSMTLFKENAFENIW